MQNINWRLALYQDSKVSDKNFPEFSQKGTSRGFYSLQ